MLYVINFIDSIKIFFNKENKNGFLIFGFIGDRLKTKPIFQKGGNLYEN